LAPQVFFLIEPFILLRASPGEISNYCRKTMMKFKIYYPACLILAVVVALLFSGCTSQNTIDPPSGLSKTLTGKEIQVFAGSASKPPLDEAARAFEKQNGAKVYLTYGGSGTVLSQMKLTRIGDIYIPGSPDFMSKAEKDGIIDPASIRIIAYLIPSINVQSGNPLNIQSLSDLTRPGLRVGIGNPATVCVGLYAVEVLDYNYLLKEVYPNILTQAASCESTAALVSLKSVDAVVGWSIFQDWDPQNIQTVYLKPSQIPRLAYIPAAISTFAKEKDAAEAFLEFLTSATGQEIFRKWGYDVTEKEARQYAPDAEIGGDYELPDLYKSLSK